jgi:hypothetical protein
MTHYVEDSELVSAVANTPARETLKVYHIIILSTSTTFIYRELPLSFVPGLGLLPTSTMVLIDRQPITVNNCELSIATTLIIRSSFALHTKNVLV